MIFLFLLYGAGDQGAQEKIGEDGEIIVFSAIEHTFLFRVLTPTVITENLNRVVPRYVLGA